jgi:thiol-disulfide isomerase/thioredoxin
MIKFTINTHRLIWAGQVLALFVAVLFNGVHAQQTNMAQISGKVTEVIVSGNFTYVEIEHAGATVWAAGIGGSPIKKGDKVSFSAQAPMRDFQSKNLNRTFPLIYFAKEINVVAENASTDLLLEHMNAKQSVAPAVAKLLAKNKEVPVGGLLREVSMDGLNGTRKMLSDYQGKPLLINVWASWCGPCRAEMGSLQRLATKYNGNAFNIIGISTDDYRDDALSAIKMSNIKFENYIDHKLVLEKMLGARTIPLTVLVDAQGRVLKKIRGAREWDSTDMISTIEKDFNLN